MRAALAACMALAALAGWAGAEDKQRTLWLAVTRPALAKALEPLAERRARQGMEAVISIEPLDLAVAALKDRAAAHLLLVGAETAEGRDAPWRVPSTRRALYRWRRDQGPDYLSDAAWGAPEGSWPRYAVGRIPARSPGDVAAAIRKIAAWEDAPPSLADLDAPVWAGSPGYEPWMDGMATGLLSLALLSAAPGWLRPRVMSGDGRHALAGWPPEQAARFGRELSEAGAFALMIGHGAATSFHSMNFEEQPVLFTVEDARRLTRGRPGPPLALLSCEGGDFGGRETCLGQALFDAPAGPVAVMAATTESHPLPNYLTAMCLAAALGGAHERIGDLWLATLAASRAARDPVMEMALRDVEGSLEDPINTGRLRQDQAFMYALFGDPATRLRLPRPLAVEVKAVDGALRWRVERPPGAAELHVGFRLLGRPFPNRPAGSADPKTTWRLRDQANEVFGFQPLPQPEAWQGELRPPGRGVVRFVAVGEGAIWAGATSATGDRHRGDAP